MSVEYLIVVKRTGHWSSLNFLDTSSRVLVVTNVSNSDIDRVTADQIIGACRRNPSEYIVSIVE